jgi:hypothetical protein
MISAISRISLWRQSTYGADWLDSAMFASHISDLATFIMRVNR